MWFEVTKDFGHRRVGEVIELKEDSQFQLLVDAGMLKETEAPQPTEVKEVDPNSAYTTDMEINDDVNDAKAKPGRKPKQ